MKIILASSSIGRKKVLEKLSLKFEVVPANIDEEKFTAANPSTLVKQIAKEKATAVAKILRYKDIKILSNTRMARNNFRHSRTYASASSSIKDYVLVQKTITNPGQGGMRKFVTASLDKPKTNYLIIAADSMVLFAGKTYGKPKTKEEAKEFLQFFSGKTHEFLTGLYIINTKTNKIYQASQKTKVKFEKLTPKEIDDYVKIAPATSFAGAYSLEEKGARILRSKIKVLGSESNVLGLPLEKLIPILRENQIKLQSLRLKFAKILCDRT